MIEHIIIVYLWLVGILLCTMIVFVQGGNFNWRFALSVFWPILIPCTLILAAFKR